MGGMGRDADFYQEGIGFLDLAGGENGFEVVIKHDDGFKLYNKYDKNIKYYCKM